ncbi:hypothetical protein ACCAA_50114 [Candidatus Accumulibacter aalborgensis]|uniref:Uncharacterized protein n=1 Tax=Candidatus Accumulibacter aalborgensis TaxID=1860102 RepID=A0A1A8XRZ2_9PROT|nr:hypothetical protein ACCAA_50114 [Candidatus Accumulibacter aalborgensis]
MGRYLDLDETAPGTATGGIAELFMGTALADFREAESNKNCCDLIRFENRNIAHNQATATF